MGVSRKIYGSLIYIPSVRPPVRPSDRPSARPSIRPSARPSVRLSVRPPVRPWARPSVRPSVLKLSFDALDGLYRPEYGGLLGTVSRDSF